VKLSNRLQLLRGSHCPTNLRARIIQALDAEDLRTERTAVAQPFPITNRRLIARARNPLWTLALAAGTALAIAVPFRDRPLDDRQLPSGTELMELSQLAEISSADAREIKQWLESYVDYPVEVPAIRNASLSGGSILRSGNTNAVAVSYTLRGRPLTYVVLPTARVLGRQLEEARVDTIVLEGFNAITWVETGTARVLLAPMSSEVVAGLAEQCRKRPMAPRFDP